MRPTLIFPEHITRGNNAYSALDFGIKGGITLKEEVIESGILNMDHKNKTKGSSENAD